MYAMLMIIIISSLCEYNTCEQNAIIDYFFHKKVASMIGFTCYELSDDVSLVRDLNKINIAATTYKLNIDSRIHLLTKATYWRLGILIDTRCYGITEISSIFNEATEYRIFDEIRSWFILGDNLTKVLSIVNDTAFGISTDFVIAVSSDLDSYEFYDVYNIFKERGGLLNVTYYGNWHKNTGLNISLSQSKFRRRANLHRLTIKAMFYKSKFKAAEVPLEEYYEDYEYPTRDSQSKFSYHVLSHLSDIYNFSLRPRESPLWKKGDAVGPIERALENREIDITGTPISFTARRLRIMKYVHQDWPFRCCFFFRNPESTIIEVREILRPLADEVWYLMSFFMPLSAIVVLMALRHDCVESGITTFSNSFLIVIGALCQQSTDTNMIRLPIRIAFFFVMVFSLLICNYYSASVVSTRLDDSTARINDSLVQLGKLNLKMASEDMVYLSFFLKKTDWDTVMFYENYWKKIPESKQFLEPDLGMSFVRKGGFAYHTHVEIAYLYIDRFFEHREICKIVEVHLGGPLMSSFAVHLNSTFVDIGRVGLIRIAETGLRIRQIHRWQYRKPLCRKDVLSATSITIYEFAPHIILLLIGVVLAVIVLAFEILISKHNYLYLRSKSRAFIKKLLSWGQIPRQIQISESFLE